MDLLADSAEKLHQLGFQRIRLDGQIGRRGLRACLVMGDRYVFRFRFGRGDRLDVGLGDVFRREFGLRFVFGLDRQFGFDRLLEFRFDFGLDLGLCFECNFRLAFIRDLGLRDRLGLKSNLRLRLVSGFELGLLYGLGLGRDYGFGLVFGDRFRLIGRFGLDCGRGFHRHAVFEIIVGKIDFGFKRGLGLVRMRA